jgi:RHS repeat-associated protein
MRNLNIAVNKIELLVFLACVLACGAKIASAQGPPATGTPAHGSLEGGPDIINLANLNAHFTIPVRHKAGRGLPLTADLGFDTSVWQPISASGAHAWQNTTFDGWNQVLLVTGYVSMNTTVISSCDSIYSNFIYYDASNTPHPIPGSTESKTGACGNSITSINSAASDGSGYIVSMTGITFNKVTAADGTVITPGTPNLSIVDRNGNEITSAYNSVTKKITYTDTLGTAALVKQGVKPQPLIFTYTAPSGSAANVTVTSISYTIKSNFGCSGIAEYGPVALWLVDRVTLPDNTFYQFNYEPTPGFAGDVTSRLSSITLPTGATISYNYTGGSSGHINCADGSASGFTRTTPDGVWTYARTVGAGAASTTTVTDPQGNQKVVQFQGIYETQRDVYQGSIAPANLLRTWKTCYNGSAVPCTGTAVTPPITRRTIIDQYGSNGLQCKHDYFYNSSGGPTEQDDYDYGSLAPGLLLRKTTTTYTASGNMQQVNVTNVGGTVVAKTTYNYDETAVVATAGTPQHVAVTGARGNLTSVNHYKDGTNFLRSQLTHFDTGNVQTITDVNNSQTTFAYGACGNSFRTGIAYPLALSRSLVWSCAGGVLTSVTDENASPSSIAYSDPYFWRAASRTDPTAATTTYNYSSPVSIESSLVFNSNASTVDVVQTVDSLGRGSLRQIRQAPGSSSLDSVEQDYNSVGLPSRATVPYVGTAGQKNAAAPGTTTIYDSMGRVLSSTDASGGNTIYAYFQNDVLITSGPAPTGELTKRRQLEYDSLDRLTSVCEISSGAGSGTCGQSVPQSGYWTRYTYDALGNIVNVTQNAQGAAGSQQGRAFSYDFLGRPVSETNPESGTTNYFYDSDASCGNSNGDLVKKVDAIGTTICRGYDVLHRITSIRPSNSTNCKFFLYDTNPGVGWTEGNIKGRLSNAWIGNCTTGNPTTSNEGFNYSVRGELLNVYQWSTNTGVWSDAVATYWPNGALNTLRLFTCITNCTTGGSSETAVTPLVTYGVDGEGRIITASASSGQNPVTATTYNIFSQPTQVNYGSLDTDNFNYDSNTGRMTQYRFNVNSQSYSGTLTWNANGSLQKLVVSDPFNAADNQTCNYNHDDLSRISTVNCGASWGQNFSYDPFGNISKSVISGSTGNSFQAIYAPATNRMTNIAGFIPSYDANGNVVNDASHTYVYDSYNKPTTVDSVGLIYDAFSRTVDQSQSTVHTQVIYSPTGTKLALMNGATLKKAFIPLPGGAAAVYNSSGLQYYGHPDHLRSTRLGSTSSRTMSFDLAYAPFGEIYASSGPIDPGFTGHRQDTVGGLYDFEARQYSNQGRWPSPDPAGKYAVSHDLPQSWNRYAYVSNSPTEFVDPLGLRPRKRPHPPHPPRQGTGPTCSGFSIGFTGPCPQGDDGVGCYLDGLPASCGFVVGLINSGAGAIFVSGGVFTYKDYGNDEGLVTPSSGELGSVPDAWISYKGWLANFQGQGSPLTDDQRLRTVAHGVMKGAGALNNPSTYALWFGASAAIGAAGSGAALWEVGASAYTDTAANLATWQTFDPVGYGEAVDMIGNFIPGAPGVTSTGAGAVIGTGAGYVWDLSD